MKVPIDLSLTGVEGRGFATRLSLGGLLYRGGASISRKRFSVSLAHNEVGFPAYSRQQLLLRFHGILQAAITAGYSKHTVSCKVQALTAIYRYADSIGQDPTEHNFISILREWANKHRVARDATEHSRYLCIRSVCYQASEALEIPLKEVFRLARVQHVRKPSRGYREGDKISLERASSFGWLLMDLSDVLETRGSEPLPIKFQTRSGCSVSIQGMLSEKRCRWGGAPPSEKKYNCLRRLEARTDITDRRRRPLINLRIQVELLIFISQTGMNLSQASGIRLEHFSFDRSGDKCKVVRRYKARRGGEVVFEINSAYRTVFERYIAWLASCFGTGTDLFPRMAFEGPVSGAMKAQEQGFNAVRKICKDVGVSFYGPQKLRLVKVNWFLRSAADVAQTAEMAQHSAETLLAAYARPSPQIAIAEISRMYEHSSFGQAAVGPGRCEDRQPSALSIIPPGAARPDCVTAAGCLFCIHHRDIASEDHAWSLASFKRLKLLESLSYSNLETAAQAPPVHAIRRLDEKLESMARLEGGQQWVDESVAKVAEGDYHPYWKGFIVLAEIIT